MNVNVHDTGLPQQTLPSCCFAWGSVADFHFPDGLTEEQNLFSWKLRRKKKTYRACRERNISLLLSIKQEIQQHFLTFVNPYPNFVLIPQFKMGKNV